MLSVGIKYAMFYLICDVSYSVCAMQLQCGSSIVNDIGDASCISFPMNSIPGWKFI